MTAVLGINIVSISLVVIERVREMLSHKSRNDVMILVSCNFAGYESINNWLIFISSVLDQKEQS